ncbi:Nmad5 [Pseudanabaena phage Pam3]|nr:Nmad5 [Pseudanabaena phage Pam3]
MTHHIREKLLKDLIARSFKERAQAQVDAQKVFAAEVYKACFTEKEHKLMASLPKGWLVMDDDIKVQIAHEVRTFHFSGSGGNSYLPSELSMAGAELEHLRFPIPYNKYIGSPVVAIFDADHPIRAMFDELENARRDLVAEISKAITATKKVLESVGSVKKLIEVWPEVEAFARPYQTEGERRAILPAIPREQINAMLGLPPSPQEAIQ